MISEDQAKQIKEELDNCKRPFFLFDDDPDGTSAFLLLYRYKNEGKGMPVKSAPKIDLKFLKKIREYEPDKIFVLDVPIIDQDFLDQVKLPVIWIDHHGPLKRDNVKYFNPRKNNKDDISSTTINCFEVVKEERPQDMWIAAIGAVGDWQIPPFKDEFCEKYPDLLDKDVIRPEVALFDSELGKLIKIISFMLKGKSNIVMKGIKILTRMESPYEILKQTTARGKFIYKYAEKNKEKFDELIKEAVKKNSSDKLLLFTYQDQRMSFTKELSNELLYKFPDKIIIIGREKSGEMKMSLRSSKILLPPIVEKALKGLNGYGGGHEHACGACVNLDDFDKFIEQLKKELK